MEPTIAKRGKTGVTKKKKTEVPSQERESTAGTSRKITFAAWEREPDGCRAKNGLAKKKKERKKGFEAVDETKKSLFCSQKKASASRKKRTERKENARKKKKSEPSYRKKPRKCSAALGKTTTEKKIGKEVPRFAAFSKRGLLYLLSPQQRGRDILAERDAKKKAQKKKEKRGLRLICRKNVICSRKEERGGRSGSIV